MCLGRAINPVSEQVGLENLNLLSSVFLCGYSQQTNWENKELGLPSKWPLGQKGVF